MVYCGATILSPHPKDVSTCPEDCIERHPSHTEIRKSEALITKYWHDSAVFLSVPWFQADAARRSESTFRMQLYLSSDPQKTLARDWRLPLHGYQQKVWKITAAKPRVEGRVVHGTEGVTACPSEVWLWISPNGALRAIPPYTLCSELCQTAQPWLLWVSSLYHT